MLHRDLKQWVQRGQIRAKTGPLFTILSLVAHLLLVLQASQGFIHVS